MIRKIIIIISGIFLVICAGSCNIYPLYLSKMMEKFNYSLSEVNLYGTFINMGLWIAFPMGWIYDSLGPKISCLIGAVLLAGSYFVLHFILNSTITNIPLIVFLIIALVMGQGSALCYTTSVTTNLKNFRFKESSAIVGLLVANMAISPSIFTTYRDAFRDIKTGEFFLIVAIFLVIVIFICGAIFHNIKRVYDENESKQSYQKYKEKKIIKFLIFINIFILVTYTFGVIYNSVSVDENDTHHGFPLVIIWPILQLFNLVVIILEIFNIFDKVYYQPYLDKKAARAPKIQKIVPEVDNNKVEYQNEIKNTSPEEKETNKEGFLEITLPNEDNNNVINETVKDSSLDEINKNEITITSPTLFLGSNNKNEQILKPNNVLSLNEAENNNDITFKEALTSMNVILLFIILTFGIGSDIANLNNIEFIISAITRFPPSGHPTTGRMLDINNSNSTDTTNTTVYGNPTKQTNMDSHNIIYSYVILYFIFNSFIRITSGLVLDSLIKNKKFFYYLVAITIIGFISQVLGIFMDKSLLLISISLAGAAHGGFMTFTPVFVRNEFGLRHMGKILGFLSTGCALGSLIISNFIFIAFFNSYTSEENKNCFGSKCFAYSYVITSLLYGANVVMALILLKNYLKKANQEKIMANKIVN